MVCTEESRDRGGAVIIVFDYDVVARPGNDLGGRAPDPDGMALWRTHHDKSMGSMGIVYPGSLDNTEILQSWLMINGVKAPMYEILDTTDPALQADKICRILAASGKRSIYVGANPDTVREVYARGSVAILFMTPHVVRPEWGGGKMIKAWTELTAEIDNQRAMKAEKNWGELS